MAAILGEWGLLQFHVKYQKFIRRAFATINGKI